MAREKNPNREKARQIWAEYEGKITNRRLAELLKEDEKKIAVWKQRDKWNVVQQTYGNVVQQKNNVVQQNAPKPGAPKGNINALGHGAPRGNKNAKGNKGGQGGPPGNKKAVTTGEYETIWFDCLDEDEQELFSKINTDTVAQVEEGIVFYTIRERRMMKRIQELVNGLTEKQRKVLQERQETKEPVTVNDDRTGNTKTVMVSVPSLVVTSVEETEYRKIEDILKIEEALTRVQDKKTRLLALKHDLENDGKENTASAEDHAKRVQEAWAKRKR